VLARHCPVSIFLNIHGAAKPTVVPQPANVPNVVRVFWLHVIALVDRAGNHFQGLAIACLVRHVRRFEEHPRPFSPQRLRGALCKLGRVPVGAAVCGNVYSGNAPPTASPRPAFHIYGAVIRRKRRGRRIGIIAGRGAAVTAATSSISGYTARKNKIINAINFELCKMAWCNFIISLSVQRINSVFPSFTHLVMPENTEASCMAGSLDKSTPWADFLEGGKIL